MYGWIAPKGSATGDKSRHSATNIRACIFTPAVKILTSFFVALLFCCSATFAQKKGQALVDSLLQALPHASADTNKVGLLDNLSYTLCYINPDEGLKYGKQALQLSEKLLWAKGIAGACSAIGSNYANKADYANALDFEYKSLRIYERLNDLPQQALMLRNIGIVYHTSKNQPKALEYDRKALDIYKQLKNEEGIAALYNNMANVYYTMDSTKKVLEYNLASLNLYQKIDNKEGTARMLGNIANFYAEQHDFSRAMAYYFDALRKETILANKNAITRNMGNIGETYLDIARDTSGHIQPDSLIPEGRSANLRKALQFLTTTITNAKQLGQTEYVLAFEETLSDAYLLSGDKQAALSAYKDFIATRDSVYDVEKYNAATRRELDYEYGKQQDSVNYQKQLSDIKLVNEKNSRTREKAFFIGGISLVLFFSGFIYRRWRISQHQKKIIEREKQRSDTLLLNILPTEIAMELKQKGRSDARFIEQITVLFTDFKGFTQISEQLSPEKLVAEIHECFSAFDLIMERHGVEKIKTIGDAYMAAGGLPIPNNTHAADVVNSALDIRRFMDEWIDRKRSAGEPYFEIRIGIHTGPVIAGIVGVKKFQYDIWGDTVNTASRMESSGETGKVNISMSTYNLVKDQFTCVHRGKIKAKNKGEIDMYFVEKKAAQPTHL